MTEPQVPAAPPRDLKRQLLASIQLFLVTAIWGSGFVFTKNALDATTPLYFLFLRFSAGALVTALCCGKRLRLLRRSHIKIAVIVGTPLFFGFALQTIGLQYTAVGSSAFITCTYVVFAPLVYWLFTRRLGLGQLLFAVAALIGLAIFSLDGQFRVNVGDLWTLGCAIAYAVHFVVLDRYTHGLDSLLLSLLQLSMVAVLSGICAVVLEPWPNFAEYGRPVWIAVLYCAVFSTALAYYLQTAVQKVLSPTQASVMFSSEAVFGAFFGWLILGELFSIRQTVGALILLGCIIGVILLPWLQQRRADKQAAAH